MKAKYSARAAAESVRNASRMLTPEEKRTLLALILLSDDDGRAEAPDEMLSWVVAILEAVEADGADLVTWTLGARAEVRELFARTPLES